MIFARRAGVVEDEVVLDPSVPRAVPRPNARYYYNFQQRKGIEAHVLANGWSLEVSDKGHRKYISPEGKACTNGERNTLNVVLWYYFPQFLLENSEARAAELARKKREEEKCFQEVPALYNEEISPPLPPGECDPTTSSTSTPNGTTLNIVRDASGFLETLTEDKWVVQQHKLTRCRRFIPPKNLATSSKPYYNLADVARDFYPSFLTTFTYEPLPVVEPQPHAAEVAAFLEDDDASSLCLGLDNLKLTSAVRMDIDEESNETNPFKAWWKAPTSQRIQMEHGATSLSFDPDDTKIDKSILSREFSLSTSRDWRSLWPPGGLWRRLKNGHYVNITRPEDARIGDLYVIPNGKYKGHTLYVRKLMWAIQAVSKASRFTDAEVNAYNKKGKLPCCKKTVQIHIQYSFTFPREVNKLIPTCFAWADRNIDGTALHDDCAWKEMIAEGPHGLCCSTCDNFVGKPVLSKDGEVLYHQTVTQFDQDGVDPRHKSPIRKASIAYRDWELRQGISEWKCTMCHVNKSISEQLRPDEKHLASGDVGAWPNSLPPWEK